MDWVSKQDEVNEEERKKGYFKIVEGTQTFVLLSHCAPLAQVFDPATKKYRAAVEGDRRPSVKGVCWVLQEGLIKEAKLPYTIVKEIRALQQNPEWEFEIPFPHTFTLTAKGAGTKEVAYSINASPKKVELSEAILTELKGKPTPEDLVERIKGGGSKVSPSNSDEPDESEYPDAESEGINPDDVPF